MRKLVLAAAFGILLVAALLIVVLLRHSLYPSQPTQRSSPSIQASQAIQDLEARRAELDESVWKEELEAQRYEDHVVQLWDNLRSTERPWEMLAETPLHSISIAELAFSSSSENNIDRMIATGSRTLTAREWKAFIGRTKQRFRLVQSEWHHSKFESARDGPQSWVTIALHIIDTKTEERIILKGDLKIEWAADGTTAPNHIDASQLNAWRRKGPPQFRLAATLPATAKGATDFLAAYDLDGDGLSEILFGDRVFRNRGNGSYSAERLGKYRSKPLQSAVLADFNSDGRTDLLCADPQSQPQLYLADDKRRFSTEPITVDAVPAIRGFSAAITTGDVNADGFLDVWLTQYKSPYRQGQMPTPYYDANDGFPSYLLINNGRGAFTDETAARGLAAKRTRRTYSSSFVDIDADGDLDLVVVSDFAGLDVHRNDGSGVFRDVTSEIVDEAHNFGMSHTLADFDGDMAIDLFVCGMGSTTARRLDAMGAGRQDRATETSMRSVMGYGNRLYLWKERFVEPTFSQQLSRTGWSWGVAEFDFDNDGDRDIYVGNGHISGPSAKDYCSIFWRHDIYDGKSVADPLLEQLFLNKQTEFQAYGSWNGYEHNCLLENHNGLQFVESAFLFGLAHEFDTRNVVADDIDGNGFVDLLIVDQPRGHPANLQVWKNHGSTGNWIGVVLPEQASVLLPGTRVVVRSDAGDQVSHVVNGDSFNSQHATTMHFGLGDADRVDAIEVTRPDGTTQVIQNVNAGKYHFFGSDSTP